MKPFFCISIWMLLVLSACNRPANNSQAQGKDSSTQSSKPAETKSQSNSTSGQNFSLDTAKLKSGEVYYQCSMDTDVVSDKPGDCPKCGMALAKKKKK